MASIHVQAFNSALSQARATARNARNEIKSLSMRRKEINAIGKKLAMCLDPDDSFWLYMMGSTPTFHITFRNLESFKCLKLESALWLLETIGKAVRTKDYAEYLNREYNYEIEGAMVTLNAYVKSDSATCRKVAVGTTTETVTKYELQCD